MRTTIGILGAIGLGVTVAVGQAPVAPIAKPRSAQLLPPLESTSDETTTVARGVSEDIPNYPMGTTPVTPPRTPQGLWGDGVDPNIRLAGGVTTTTGAGTVTAPAVSPGDDPSVFSRGLDKIKGAVKGNGSQNPGEGPPNAESPFRGTTVNGTPVYAGPPAYRWYGYGTVTPGGNPFAPTGQSPKASANWYSVTGATPGAFPVPVTNPQRAPGSDPPTYVTTNVPRGTTTGFTPPAMTQQYSAPPTLQVAAEFPRPIPVVNPQPAPVAPPQVNTLSPGSIPPPSSLVPPEMPMPPSMPPASTLPLPLPQPPASLPKPNLPLPPVTTPQMPSAPAMPGDQSRSTSFNTHSLPVPTLPAPTMPPLPAPTFPEPVLIVPPAMPLPPEPLANKNSMPALPLPPPNMSMPAPVFTEQKSVLLEITPSSTTAQPEPSPATLPVSVTEYQLKWQPTTEAPRQGEWTTPGKTGTPSQKPSAPTTTPAPEPEAKQPGATDTSRPAVIARGQNGENAPDPIVTLIKQLCTGRAEGTDVRWTGTKRLSVCFECRTKDEAQQLVRDISARSELMPIRIDFCVLIK